MINPDRDARRQLLRDVAREADQALPLRPGLLEGFRTSDHEFGSPLELARAVRAMHGVLHLVDVADTWTQQAHDLAKAAEEWAASKKWSSTIKGFDAAAQFGQLAACGAIGLVARTSTRLRSRARDDHATELAEALVSERTHEILSAAADAVIDQLEPADGEALHPLVAYEVLRSLELFDYAVSSARWHKPRGDEDRSPDPQAEALELLADKRNGLAAPLVRTVEALLARVQLRANAHADAVALVYAGAALAIADRSERSHLEAAMTTAIRFQDLSGAWRPTRIPDREAPATGWVISTHEVSVALVETLVAMARKDRLGARPLPLEAIKAAWSALSFADQSRHRESGSHPSGWAVEEIYGAAESDAFATAIVGSMAASLKELDDEVRRQEALARLPTEDPDSEYWPSWQQWGMYKTSNEPVSDHPILPRLDRDVVHRIDDERKRQPWAWARLPCVTTILYGPPGTTKTTIVKAVAQGIRWPLVTLGPGDFIRDGLESVERRAAELFDDLLALKGAVVLFDECDELFRARNTGLVASDQTRGIAAFVTASMLPKLQDLRDRGQIVLFVLTNHFDQMDPRSSGSGGSTSRSLWDLQTRSADAHTSRNA